MSKSVAAYYDPDIIEFHEDYTGNKVGMWLFLFTELLLFAALFLAYGIYRHMYLETFTHLSAALDMGMGSLNTVVLLTSSLTMVLSITALQKNKKNLSMWLIFLTILCALAFMVVKYFEWTHKFHLGIWPGSETVMAMGKGAPVFYGLYFFMTGLHGFHVVVGVFLLTAMLYWVWTDAITSTDFIWLENSGLYWHLVDLIWIYLFPLFYLVR